MRRNDVGDDVRDNKKSADGENDGWGIKADRQSTRGQGTRGCAFMLGELSQQWHEKGQGMMGVNAQRFPVDYMSHKYIHDW